MTYITLGTVLLVYFLPTIAAYFCNRENFKSIFIINLLTGWTIFGWIVAMLWATYEVPCD